MAVVNLSEELKTHILRNASRPFNNEILKLAQLSAKTSQEFYNKFMVSPKQLELVKALPTNWLNLFEGTSYQIYVIEKDGAGLMYFVGNLDKPSYMMSHWSAVWRPGWKQDIDDTPAEKRARFGLADGISISAQSMHKMPAEIQTKYVAALEIIGQREKFLTTIKTIFDNCHTLNQTKLLWPGILQYVTEKSYLERLEKKVTKSNRAPLELEQDKLNELNMTCITHRMTS